MPENHGKWPHPNRSATLSPLALEVSVYFPRGMVPIGAFLTEAHAMQGNATHCPGCFYMQEQGCFIREHIDELYQVDFR